MQVSANDSTMRMLNKLPEVSIFFWLIKIMATTVGETVADFLNVNLHFGLTGTSVVMGGILFTFLITQLKTRQYTPWIYWVTVVLLSVFGTLLTDNLIYSFGVSLQTCTAIFGGTLLTTFAAWFAIEKTLSIHSIYTTRRELFYWAAILFTFALGTAAGDLAAEGLHLGYANSVLFFGAMIAVMALLHSMFKFNAIASFWVAYIFTRPFGVASGDLLSKPFSEGGYGMGATGTSIIFLVAILGMVVNLSMSEKEKI